MDGLFSGVHLHLLVNHAPILGAYTEVRPGATPADASVIEPPRARRPQRP